MATTMQIHGRIGQSIKRKEDARFLRGKGSYLDDFVLPDMLHMAILRSPHAHARIKSIDTAAAGAKPGVIAVVTGEVASKEIDILTVRFLAIVDRLQHPDGNRRLMKSIRSFYDLWVIWMDPKTIQK